MTPENFTEEQRLIAKTASDFVVGEVLPHVEHLEKNHDYDLLRSLVKQAAEIGLTTADELGFVTGCLVTESTAKYSGFSGTFGVHSGVATHPIAWFGTPEQKAKYLPKLESAEVIGAYCLTEPHAGSDALAARTRADLSAGGRHYILNGQKMWITNGGFADVFTVFAKVGGEKFTAFIVERGFGGVQSGAEERKMGLHGSSTTAIYFQDCKVPVENVLGEIGRGHIIAFNCLNMGRLKLAAGALGGMKEILKHAVKYAKERTAFGKPIACYGLIRQKLAEMVVRIYVTESMVYRTAGLIDAALERNGGDKLKAMEEYAIECSLNKIYASEASNYCADECVQIFGGYGYHAEYPAERAYRDVRPSRIFEGTNEINRLLATGMFLKRAMAGKVSFSLEMPEPAATPLENLKLLFRVAAIPAVKKYMTALADQQEIVAALTNIMLDGFAAECVGLRSSADIAQVFTYEALHRAELEARRIFAALGQDAKVLKPFTRQEPVDTIGLRRSIAERVPN